MSSFITFEGPEGSGKTTQIRKLALFLEEKGQTVLTTREPGGTRIGDAIRRILLGVAVECAPEEHLCSEASNPGARMDDRTETLLFNAARAQIVHEVIYPALAKGQVVLCDRYADSTLAYQGHGHGQSLDELQALITYATGGLTPDLTLYLDIDPASGLRRKQDSKSSEWNRLDAKALAFHQRVRQGYLQLVVEEPERWVQINADQPVERVHRQIVTAVETRLGPAIGD